ncbi:MAG: hypothetical protein MRY78_03100, partial [Saprospiraceae bacterium]|nr:hypothetical protein [Saprospiraceae bacterium]
NTLITALQLSPNDGLEMGCISIQFPFDVVLQSETNVNAQLPNASENSDCNEPIANDHVNGDLNVVKFAKKKQQRPLNPSWPLNADNSLLLNIESTSVEESNNTPLSSDQGAKHSIIEGEKDYFDSPIASIATLKPRLVQGREESASHLPELVQLASLYKPTPKASTSSTNRIALMSGVTQWTMGYGSEKPERASHEQNIISFQAQLNYIHRLKKDYTLMIGLQFQQLETRFDWSTALDDYTVILKDTIIQVRTNLLTGQQTEVRGDIEVNVPAVRTVRHYNRVQLYQIPIAVGKTWKIRNWQADLMAGTAVNILSENQGRTLYQGELQYYQGTSTRFIENQWAIHGLLMGRVTYQVNDYFGLSAGFQFQKSITNWSAEPDIRMHPNFFSGELGISFMLD